uniref:C2H2-type domain-containing protein n=1 Tax=Neogobius melanostomus TaxID=47308 RepID=A0A8C6WN16_9GOBI
PKSLNGGQDMEEDKIMGQDKGESQPETEEEAKHLLAAKQHATSENADIPDVTDKTDVTNVVHYNSASHIQRMTTGSGETDPQKSPVPVLSRPFVSNKPYQCAICRVSYNHAITLESHMKSVLHQTRSRN